MRKYYSIWGSETPNGEVFLFFKVARLPKLEVRDIPEEQHLAELEGMREEAEEAGYHNVEIRQTEE